MLSSCSSRFLPPLTVRVAAGASTCRGLSRTTTTRRCGSNHRRASSSTTPPTAARVVVVGAGRMGRIRADLLRANPRFAVVGLVDARLDQARAVADRYGWPAFESLEAALEATHTPQAPLDGLVVSTPTPTHQAVVEEAADAQISVFTEKPVGGTADEIRHLFAYAARAGIHVCCGFQRRWDPSYVRATQAVHAGNIGTPVAAQLFFADHPCPPKEFLLTGGGNIFLDLAAHDVDYITQALQDEVVSVYASGTSGDPELAAAGVHDHATMVMKMRQGTMVTLFLSRAATYGYDQRCEMFGTQGMVSVGNVAEHATVLSTQAGIQHAKWQHSFPQRFQHAFGLELESFADTLLHEVPWPVTAAQCIHVQQCADAARLSCETGTIVTLQAEDTTTMQAFPAEALS